MMTGDDWYSHQAREQRYLDSKRKQLERAAERRAQMTELDRSLDILADDIETRGKVPMDVKRVPTPTRRILEDHKDAIVKAVVSDYEGKRKSREAIREAARIAASTRLAGHAGAHLSESVIDDELRAALK